MRVGDILEKKGTWLELGENPTVERMAKLHNIPFATLKPYVRKEPNQRREVGVSVGRKAIIEPKAEQFMVDTLRRRNRANDGPDYLPKKPSTCSVTCIQIWTSEQ